MDNALAPLAPERREGEEVYQRLAPTAPGKRDGEMDGRVVSSALRKTDGKEVDNG